MGRMIDAAGAAAQTAWMDTLPNGTGKRVLVLAGNPNVGKSTLFNRLTGMRQHTGNWPGKTVSGAWGECRIGGAEWILVDTPGAYSLAALSAEEAVTRDFLCFGGADAAVVVCDASALERNLNFALQIAELAKRVILCVNLMDEAEKKNIRLDLAGLSRALGMPVVGMSARSGQGVQALLREVAHCMQEEVPSSRRFFAGEAIEQCLAPEEAALRQLLGTGLDAHWAALRLAEGETSLLTAAARRAGAADAEGEVFRLYRCLQTKLEKAGFRREAVREEIQRRRYAHIGQLSQKYIHRGEDAGARRQLRADRLLTGRLVGIPVMILLLIGVFYLTIAAANVPSAYLAKALFWVQDAWYALFQRLGVPWWIADPLILGVYRTLAWVVSVMLPPMAIFFPLFTLLEDLGYLPRAALNLDYPFWKCHACGKQALSMCVCQKGTPPAACSCGRGIY